MDKWLLKFVKLFNGAFVRQGVDIGQMYCIVENKLVMDRRRVYMSWKQSRQKENANHMRIALLTYLAFGFFVGIMIASLPSFLFAMVLAHGYVLFMMSMTLITDFSSVLLDTTDNQIILPRPVNGKTIFMARLIHILLYILQFTLAISLIPVIATFIYHGAAAGLMSILTFFLTVILAIFLTYLLYLLILRFSNEERVRDIVTYFQIFLAIFFMIGYQVLPRIVDSNFIAADVSLKWYAYLFPPVWMATVVDGLAAHSFDAMHWLMLVLSVGLPVVSFWFLLKVLAPSFSRKLSALNTDNVSVPKKNAGQINRSKTSVASMLAQIFCKRSLEKSSFELTWSITARDKNFRLQFYPSLGYLFVFFFIFVLGGSRVASNWAALPATNKYLWFIYLPMFTIANAVNLVAFNEQFQASWIYHSTPVAKPGELISGSAKAIFVKYFTMVYVLLFAVACYIWGVKVVPHFIYGFFNNWLCFLVMVFFTEHYLPFSRQPNTKQQAGRFVRVLLELVLVALLVGLHYLLIRFQLILYVLIPIVIAACWLLVKELQDLPWKKIAV